MAVNVIEQGLERIVYQPANPIAKVIFAHGAGAGNRHDFIKLFCEKLAYNQIEVVSFNFPYMQLAYELDKKRPPNGAKQLKQHFIDEITLSNDTNLPLFIAGKSMGGRVATIVASESLKQNIQGVIVLGYPFIPPGKPEKLTQRMTHFTECKKPVAIYQGERDTFGSVTSLATVELPKNFNLTWVKSGDHSFKPLKSANTNLENNINFVAEQTSQFIKQVLQG